MTASSSSTPFSEDLPFSLSQILGSPSFRNAAVNSVAVVPLLSERHGQTTSHSTHSFENLMTALRRHNGSNLKNATSDPTSSNTLPTQSTSELLLVVPNSSLTRPGDWRYNETPLRGFHWLHGCQRMAFVDGRPSHSRSAQDRLLNTSVRDWIDLCPSRRTAAVIGVLNLRDCEHISDLHRAEEELHSWASRYSSPPYEVTALGRSFDRDRPLERLYVFDSFDESCQMIDLSKSTMQDSILAFPPVDEEHQQMMDLHLNVVINDLAVAVFRSLEERIAASDAICQLNMNALQISQQDAASASASSSVRSSLTRIISGNPTSNSTSTPTDEPVSAANRALSLHSLANLVSPDSKLAKDSYAKSRSGSPSTSIIDTTATSSVAASVASSSAPPFSSVSMAALNANSDIQKANSSPKLITPLDAYWERGGLSNKDVDAIRRRDLARREKWAGDVSLLAGSPLDAYERYLKAAEMCKSVVTPDPLWYASALEGCAASHIAMAEAGGYGVDEYLEANFSMPEEVMNLLTRRDGDPNATSNNASNKRSANTSAKQTLPEIVCALCEEALNITNRHEKLGAFHAELLLKLARYVAESSEGHLRCRWGEGECCYAGEVNEIPRWQKPSVSKLKVSDSLPQQSKSSLDGMTTINSFNRTKQVCELLHEAVSIASLDSPTRVDVAACCVRLCLSGVKATQWSGSRTERIPLPRKAAFFAVVAAEAMSGTTTEGGEHKSRDLWLLATQLYAKRPNVPGSTGRYGWAVLRATTLHALSLQGNNHVSLIAAEELLSLLSEINLPPPTRETGVHDVERAFGNGDESIQSSGHGGTSGTSTHVAGSTLGKTLASVQSSSSHGGKNAQSHPGGKPPLESSGHQFESSAGDSSMNKRTSSFGRQLRESFTSLTSGSLILAMESRWAENDIVPFVDIPLAISTQHLLGCVWRVVSLDRCSEAQMRCLGNINKLHRSLPTESMSEVSSSLCLPFYVSSEMTIQTEPDLELERTKLIAKTGGDYASDPMSTFYNPFANKRSNKSQAALVAEGEERAMCVELSNRLAVPVSVLRCQLEFKNEAGCRIQATPLSFTIPSKANGFPVHFPFCVLPPSGDSSNAEARLSQVVEVTGMKVTFAGRVVSLPISPGVGSSGPKSSSVLEIPAAASLYQRQLSAKVSTPSTDQASVLPRIESCPPQPLLQVSLANAGAPLDADRPLHICLVEGELYCLPALRLTNYKGPCGMGTIERLQILAVDIPGVADRAVYDSAIHESPVDQDFTPQLGKDQPPIKLRCVSSSLKLSDMNESHGPGGLITIQIAASHRVQTQVPKGTVIKLRFRYRGVPGASSEYWRRRDISFRVSCVPGPRISSMDFRPNFFIESSYTDVCRALQYLGVEGIVPSVAAFGSGADDCEPEEDLSLFRVGMDSGVHVASKDVGFVLTVANETSAELTLSKVDGGSVGGFSLYPMSSIRVNAGVSAKIPVVIPRIPRICPGSTVEDLVDQLMALTRLQWEVRRSHEDTATTCGRDLSNETAQGSLHIPRACLADIIMKHPSFVSLVCEAPCSVELLVQDKNVEKEPSMSVDVGRPVRATVKVSLASWVPQSALKRSRMTLEFLCTSTSKSLVAPSVSETNVAKSNDFVWCGKTRQSFLLKDSKQLNSVEHSVKVAFCTRGVYVFSACVRLSCQSSPHDEMWLAPVAAVVNVGMKSTTQSPRESSDKCA